MKKKALRPASYDISGNVSIQRKSHEKNSVKLYLYKGKNVNKN